MTLFVLALAIIIAIQFFYVVIVFGRLAFFKKISSSGTESNEPISLIICCKNELENLQNHLSLFLGQDYPKFEVVVINDCSTDGTKEFLEEQSMLYKHLKTVNVEPNETFWSNKKYALTLGIKATKHDHLVFTDADCKPVSNQWLKHMSKFDFEKQIILGYSPYEQKAGFLNLLIRFETVFTAIQYLSWAIFSKPYMGVGRNLAYKKSLFFEKNGFVNHIKIRSGDDDLFINETAKKSNTQIQIHPESFVFSIPKMTWAEWIYQKRRHITTSTYYKWTDKIKLSLFYFSQIAFFVLMILNLIYLNPFEIILGLIGFRYLFVLIIFGMTSNKLKDAKLTWFYILLEPLLILLQFYIFAKNKISKPLHWK